MSDRAFMRQVGALVLLLSSWCAPAAADEPPIAPTPDGDAQAEQVTSRGEPHPRKPWLTIWSRDPARWFFAVRADVGYPFLRTRFSLGYGKPHELWGGLDVTPIVSSDDGGAYAGLRYEGKYFDARSGALYLYSFNRSFLPEQDHYDLRDIDTRRGDPASYVTWDSEFKLKIPLGPLRFVVETQPILLFGVPDESYVYMAPVGAVTAQDWTLRQAYVLTYSFDAFPHFYIGPAAEFVWSQARAPEMVWRAGAVVLWELYSDIQLRTEFMPVVHSPDQLGFHAGRVLELSVRWRWATH